MTTILKKMELNNISLPQTGMLDAAKKLLLIILISFGIFSVFLLVEQRNPLEVFAALVNSFVGNSYNTGEIFVKMTPILLASLGALIPAKVGIFNCGGEGQLIIGALTANIAGVYLLSGLPSILAMPLMFAAAVIGGMLWGVIPLFCKMKLRMNETLTTLLMNYIAVRFVAYLIFGPIQDPNGNNYPMSQQIPQTLRIDAFAGSRANYTIFIAILLAVAIWYFLSKTETGFRTIAIGGNNRAAEFAGLDVKKYQIVAFLLSAGICGLAGGFLMAGTEFQMREFTASGYGFMGFLSAGIVANNPLLAIASSFVLGILNACGTTLELTTGMRSSTTTIFMSIILLTIFGLGKGKRDQ